MFHYKLIELESEIAAKKQSQKGFDKLPMECEFLLQQLEAEIGVSLGDSVVSEWSGWLCYRRNKNSLIVYRGRAFKERGWRAGLDVALGLDTITEYKRGFDVSPPQDLDHLLINFGGEAEDPRVFLWYGENIAPYKLIFQADVNDNPDEQLKSAIVEGCIWIIKRPRDKTLDAFLKEIASG